MAKELSSRFGILLVKSGSELLQPVTSVGLLITIVEQWVFCWSMTLQMNHPLTRWVSASSSLGGRAPHASTFLTPLRLKALPPLTTMLISILVSSEFCDAAVNNHSCHLRKIFRLLGGLV